MAKQQSPEQRAAFKALCRENNLDAAYDVWQQRQSGQWIIGRTGIEKIQGHNNIGIELELCAAGIDFAVVKATATRTVKPEGKVARKLSIQSLGSANAKNSRVDYYAEMAEKRAKSRAILQLMGFYALDVYGEDEADDFKRTADSESLARAVQADAQAARSGKNGEDAALRAQFEAEGKSNENLPLPTGKGAGEPKNAVAEAAAPVSAPQAASTTAAPSSAPNPERERLLNQIIKELASRHITPIERNRMMMGLNKLTLEQAEKSLSKLVETIDYRPSPEALTKARLALRSFANANSAALGEAEYHRLNLRAGALTVTAVDLIQEMQEAEQRLKTPETAAA